ERVGVTPPVRRPYTAPERVAGAVWDRRADVFSLAQVIHELLWNRRAAGFGDAVAAALTDIAGIHLSRIRPIFARALAADPGERFDSATEFAAALKNAMTFHDSKPRDFVDTSFRLRMTDIEADAGLERDEPLFAVDEPDVVIQVDRAPGKDDELVIAPPSV